MDKEGFTELLKSRNLSAEKIDASIVIAERFEAYLAEQGGKNHATTAWQFCQMLIHEKLNTYDNLLALARYGRFIKDNAIYVALLELVDGAEVQSNLYQKVGTLFGDSVRDEVFGGIGISPLGLPPAEKPYDLFPVLDRLIGKMGNEQVELLLSACLRDLPDEYFLEDRKKFLEVSNIDDFLRSKHQALVEELRRCQQKGELFFSQEITDEVLEYVQEHPETECGVRAGNILYITKIPYHAKEYLKETDPTMKRYYACHCPWVRYGIKDGNLRLDPIFCNCSGGFSKKPWEVIFRQTLQVKVLESALKGDFRCRFAIYLPEDWLTTPDN
jgi:hypothetical protein